MSWRDDEDKARERSREYMECCQRAEPERQQKMIDTIVKKRALREALSAAGYRASEEELRRFCRETKEEE